MSLIHPCQLTRSLSFSLLLFCILVSATHGAEENALQQWLSKPDRSFYWEKRSQEERNGYSCVTLQMQSQIWQGIAWKHPMRVVKPTNVSRKGKALLFIMGSSEAEDLDDVLTRLANETGMIVASIHQIPNQPLYDGLVEDALIAHTFKRFLETGDKEWPLLFPMVKGAIKGMDSVQAVADLEWGEEISQFFVTGASKRGWTTWLTGAVDPRVMGIAPMVIDTLNMKKQLKWAQTVYGEQSAMIGDYTKLRLHERMNDPGIVRLRSWIDPWFYRERLTMPKLILLGTNDPYWTVDSLRHYYDELPEPKLVFQTPNAGHNLNGGKEAIPVLAQWMKLVADGDTLPTFKWKFTEGGRTTGENCMLGYHFSLPQKRVRIWKAHSETRDFRRAKWTAESFDEVTKQGTLKWGNLVEKPSKGFSAWMAEADLDLGNGETITVSSQVKVLPDFPDPEVTHDSFNFRMPESEKDFESWLENMVVYHNFTELEVQLATGLTIPEIRRAMAKYRISSRKPSFRKADAPLRVLPYPGGRHPRIGFLEGAIDPQRETKLSVFTPWDPGSYVVVDVPEAIWSNLGLTYLAHTHVPTIWTEQGIEMERKEWKQHADGSLSHQRRLPNGIEFDVSATPSATGVGMKISLKNGTDQLLQKLRVQNCVMLKGAKGMEQQHNDNKVMRGALAAAGDRGKTRWVITAWEPLHRTWANAKCPCLHSDPVFPDTQPGKTSVVRGWLGFYEGRDIEAELKRLEVAKPWLN